MFKSRARKVRGFVTSPNFLLRDHRLAEGVRLSA